MSATYQGFDPLNESPSEKEGKLKDLTSCSEPDILALNESPSEKEGKSWVWLRSGLFRRGPQ